MQEKVCYCSLLLFMLSKSISFFFFPSFLRPTWKEGFFSLLQPGDLVLFLLLVEVRCLAWAVQRWNSLGQSPGYIHKVNVVHVEWGLEGGGYFASCKSTCLCP